MKMVEPTSTLARHDLEAKIVRRCWQDEAFRKEFTADPPRAFVKYLQLPATSLPKIVIHEEPAGWWHIVLPLQPANVDELSEQDLEMVAGGASIIKYVVATAASAGASAATVAISTSVEITPTKGW
jgi:hypothetical protein